MSSVVPSRRRTRRIAGWATVIGALVVVGLAGAFLGQADQWRELGVLDPESAGPDGARAVARVLAEQGIDVQVVRDRETAQNVLDAADGASTLVLPDTPALSEDALLDLTDEAGEIVLIEPRSATLNLLLAGSGVGGAAPAEEIAPDCADPDAQRAGAIVAGSLYEPGDGVQACYPVGDDGFALLRLDHGAQRLSAVDGRVLLANDSIEQAGNAALAISLLGSQPTLVWYQPSLTDGDVAAPTLGELTPRWVTPAIVLLIVAAIAAGVWRGRRFGPLVAENLPVMVRASETSTGRAHLYARSRDAAHAIAELRAPATVRLGRLLGLGPRASGAEVAEAAAARIGADRAAVRGILQGEIPADDRGLVDLEHRLRDLEARVRAAVRPERTTP